MTSVRLPAVPVPRDAAPSIARDYESRAREAMLADVRVGLSHRQKELSPKYFYDHRGSELFEEITTLPEYYLTRAERALLRRDTGSIVGALRPRTLVELGAGSASKTRLILDALRAAGSLELYVPVDVSADFLEETAAKLRAEYRGLRVTPAIADIGSELGLPNALSCPVLFAFLGSTIGNFAPSSAVALLSRVRSAMAPFDRLLLGADLRKDVRVIETAYNDSRGVTAAFNRNVLSVLNRELGADFDLSAFSHRAFYARARHRIEMHLVSVRRQVVTIPRIGQIQFREGESIRTEISCKYDRRSLRQLLRRAKLRLERWYTDDATFALAVALPIP
jgi:L-histidine Nalpha-methyltransferase